MALWNGAVGRIYYEESGEGDPVLLIPGWGGSIRELDDLRRALAERYHVIAADPPGSGRSEPQPRAYTPSYYADDSASFVALIEELGGTPAHVIGHSDGGEYALLMAHVRPSAVRSIVTWGSAGRLAPPPGMLDTWRKVVDDPIPPLKRFSEHLTSVYGADNARVMVSTQADALEAIVASGGDLGRAHAPEITCPALLITGEHDVFAPPALVAELAREMARAEFLEVAGAGHPLHLTHTEWLTTTVIAWLETHFR